MRERIQQGSGSGEACDGLEIHRTASHPPTSQATSSLPANKWQNQHPEAGQGSLVQLNDRERHLLPDTDSVQLPATERRLLDVQSQQHPNFPSDAHCQERLAEAAYSAACDQPNNSGIELLGYYQQCDFGWLPRSFETYH